MLISFPFFKFIEFYEFSFCLYFCLVFLILMGFYFSLLYGKGGLDIASAFVRVGFFCRSSWLQSAGSLGIYRFQICSLIVGNQGLESSPPIAIFQGIYSLEQDRTNFIFTHKDSNKITQIQMVLLLSIKLTSFLYPYKRPFLIPFSRLSIYFILQGLFTFSYPISKQPNSPRLSLKVSPAIALLHWLFFRFYSAKISPFFLGEYYTIGLDLLVGLGSSETGGNFVRLFCMILLMKRSSYGLVSISFAFFNFMTFYFSTVFSGLFASIVLSF